MERKIKISAETLNDIKNQMEYYLSDDNLKGDSFFHEKISENKDGYIDLDLFLKCNKVKKAKWTKENIIEGVKLSTEIELSENNNKIRRKNNRKLPELQLLKKKRKAEEDEDQKDEVETNDPIILSIKSEQDVTTKWNKIKDEFTNLSPNVEVIYGRFKNKMGHFAILKKKDENLKYAEKFELENFKFTVAPCIGDELIDFWKEHGKHFEMCTKSKLKNKNSKNSKNTKETKNKKKSTHLKEAIKIGQNSFVDISNIKSVVRKIISNNKDNIPLQGNDKDFILDLLKFHHNSEEKLKNLQSIAVGKPEKYQNSRCFIITKNDNTKDDFSFQKCIEEIEKKYIE